MEKNTNRKGVGLKKTLATGAVLGTLLLPQVAYASNSPKKEKAPVSIILGARGGPGSYGGEFGFRYKNLALVGNLGSGSGKDVQKIEENVFGDVYFQGIEKLGKPSSFGASLEYHMPGWVIGVGGGLEKVTREIEENLIRRTGSEETLLASNINSIPENKFTGYIYTGPRIKIKKLEINPNIGYKTGIKKGLVANLRIVLPISKGDR